jgi:hypothetical protein
MNNYRIPVLVFCFHLAAALFCSAQQTTARQAPIATAGTTPQAFTEEIRNTVAFLSVVDDPSGSGVIGTCFFVSVGDNRLPENQHFVYLVTNRHVAQPGIDVGTPYPVLGVLLRMNLVSPRGQITSVQEQIPLDTHLHWYFPKDDAVDLAVLPLAPDMSIYSYKVIPSSLIVTSDQVKTGDVVDGDRVVFAGYFSNFSGEKRLDPIVREGVIAMLPEEALKTTLGKPGQLYLADLHAFHGNSGSPVFVNMGGEHHGNFILGDNYRLLGLVSGYYPESVGYSVPAATVLTGEVHDNSGIATIVPAEEINKLLNSAELQAERDNAVANLPKKP